MTTIAHISDTHLGNRQYGSDIRRQDFIDAFEAAVETAIEAGVDAIIHTGDLFHRRTPPLPEVNACIRILQQAADADIPFHAIVGNHDRKMDDQWLDLIEHTGTASRLDQSPTIVGGDGDDPAVALYGIDAIPAPAWESTSFGLDSPPEEHTDAYRLLCMHQLLSPPVPEIMADYPTEAVIDRLDVEIDGLALGDYHEAESATVGDVDVWYAGSTERGGAGEAAPRSITLLESIDDTEGNSTFRRSHHELETRPFKTIDIDFGENDGRAHARDVIQSYDLAEAVAVATLTGKRTSLTAGGVHDLLLDNGAAVARVDDNRGREHLNVDLENAPSTDVEDPDTLISERLAEEDFSEATLAVESKVRGESTATNSLDGTAEEIISEAQEAAFSEGGPNPAAVFTEDKEDSSGGGESESDEGATDEKDEDFDSNQNVDTKANTEVESGQSPADDNTVGEAAPEPASPTGEDDVATDGPPKDGNSTADNENVETDTTEMDADTENETTGTDEETNTTSQASFADLGGESR